MPVRTRSFLMAKRPMTRSIPDTPDPVVTTTVAIATSQLSVSIPSPETPKKKRTRSPIKAAVVTPPSKSAAAEAVVSTHESSQNDSEELTTTTVKPKKKQRSSIAKTFEPPNDWKDIYSLVKELRSDATAPCDHSGCEALAEPTETPETLRFQILLSLMLSSQTKDAVVGEAIRRMQQDGVATVAAIANMSPETLDAYIAKVGFHNNKTKYILATVKILQDQYEGDIPNTAEQLMQLPGVGPKMAYICESAAFGTQSGIGVDTHMHRIFNQIDFVQTKTPEQTRLQLESWLPREYWGEVNLLFVGFGQEVQQYKTKILQKAIDCSRPAEALTLLKRCGVDYAKVGAELGVVDRIRAIMEET